MQQLKDIIYTGSHLHPSSKFALARLRARAAMKHYKRICQACGYSKHVEVCHLKPLSSFDLDTESSFNDDSNLLLLCPNCHWELDNLSNFDLTKLQDRHLDLERLELHKTRLKHKLLLKRINSIELHKMVWSKPSVKVAIDLNISSSAVKRLCKRRDILTPPRGFWRKIETENTEGLSCPLPKLSP
jgi:5-methylcytosine-specific restriction endonuclease McrA